jgi:hypothetical protein
MDQWIFITDGIRSKAATSQTSKDCLLTGGFQIKENWNITVNLLHTASQLDQFTKLALRLLEPKRVAQL